MVIGHYKSDGKSQTYGGIELNGRIGAIFSMIISIPIILIGVVLLLLTLFSYYSDFKHKNFMETNAIVTEAYLENNEDTSYKYKISYTINNKVYYYDTISFIERNGECITWENINGFNKCMEYHRIMGQELVGENLTIYYNPKNPNDIYLGDKKTSLFFPIFTFFILFCGIKAFTYNLKKFKNPNDNYGSSGISLSTKGISFSVGSQNQSHSDSNISKEDIKRIDL